MNRKNNMEIARNILTNAAMMNVSKEFLLKISRKIDDYIVEYYRQDGGHKDGWGQKENS